MRSSLHSSTLFKHKLNEQNPFLYQLQRFTFRQEIGSEIPLSLMTKL